MDFWSFVTTRVKWIERGEYLSVGVGKGKETRTLMSQMLPKLHIPMAPRRDMKIPLHLIPLQTPINPTTIRLDPPSHPRRLLKLPPPLPHLPQHMSHMRILLLQILPPSLILPIPAPLHFLRVHPHRPGRGVLAQHVPSEDAIARGVLHVDVQVGALHVHDGVEVDLQGVRDAFFDAELLRLAAGVPAAELGEGEEGGEEDEEEGGVAAGGGAAGVGRFGFRCRGEDGLAWEGRRGLGGGGWKAQ